MTVSLNEEKAPIQGWLGLIATLLWVSAIFKPIGFIIDSLWLSFRRLFTTPNIHWVELISTPTVHGIDLVTSFGASIIAIIALIKFMKRRRDFINWFIGLQSWAILRNFVILLICIGGINSSTILMYSAIFGMIVNVALILYVLRSKRVKKTFIR